MENFLRSYQNLAYCFRKVDFYRVFLQMPKEDQEKLCANEKQLFLDALNNDDMRFSKVLDYKISKMEGISSLIFSKGKRHGLLPSL